MSKNADKKLVIEPVIVHSPQCCKSKKFVPTIKGNIKVLIGLIFYIVLNLCAAYVFILLESKIVNSGNQTVENDLRLNNSNTTTNDHKLSLNDALLLSFSISSTIGYGTVVPLTTGGKIFCLLFAILSIPYTGLLAAKMGAIMAYYVKKACRILFGSNIHAKYAGVFIAFLTGFLLFVIMPAILLRFVGNDENWSFIDSLYCVIITLTTIGFGDYVPDPSSHGGVYTTISVIVWVVAGLAWFATIINLIANALSKRAKKLEKSVASPTLKRFGRKSTQRKATPETTKFLEESTDKMSLRDDDVELFPVKSDNVGNHCEDVDHTE